MALALKYHLEYRAFCFHCHCRGRLTSSLDTDLDLAHPFARSRSVSAASVFCELVRIMLQNVKSAPSLCRLRTPKDKRGCRARTSAADLWHHSTCSSIVLANSSRSCQPVGVLRFTTNKSCFLSKRWPVDSTGHSRKNSKWKQAKQRIKLAAR